MTSTNPLVEQVMNLPDNPGYRVLVRALNAQVEAALAYLYTEEDPDRIPGHLYSWRALRALSETLAMSPEDLLETEFLDTFEQQVTRNEDADDKQIGFPTGSKEDGEDDI